MDPAQIAKRQISLPIHQVGFFNHGEFVYDPDASWDDLRAGFVADRAGVWAISFPPAQLDGDYSDAPLSQHAGKLARHIMINHFGIGPSQAPQVDPKPWLDITDVLLDRLRDAPARRMRVASLIEVLMKEPGIDHDLIEDTMRMNACMGRCEAWRDQGGIWYGASKLMKDSFARRDYLSSFSDELLAKSRRIDNLINHTGTVGSYREELLRSLIRQILPTRYHVNTGFIENSPRQIDVLIWDAERYSPLFREQDVVVVPAAAVRAIIEVKTTLSTSSLDEALEILHDVMRVDPPAIPVFKGVFAFESGYENDSSVAERMRVFFTGKQTDGIIGREHRYLGQGVNVVCVPNHNFVFQRHVIPDDPVAYPYPVLQTLRPEGRGDVRTGIFLGELLSYLDLELEPKQTLLRMFLPIFNECKTETLNDLFGSTWRPTLASSRLGAVLDSPDAAKTYLKRIKGFRDGTVAAADLNAGLESTRTGQPAATKASPPGTYAHPPNPTPASP